MNTVVQTALRNDSGWSPSEGPAITDQFGLLGGIKLHRFSRRCVPLPVVFAAMRFADGCIFTACGLAAASLNRVPSIRPAIMTALLGGCLFTACLSLGSVYTTRNLISPRLWVPQIILAALVAIAGVAASLLLTSQMTPTTLEWLEIWAGLSMLGGALTHDVGRRSVLRWRRLGRLGRRVAVLGCSQAAQSFVEHVASDQFAQVTITGVYNDRNATSAGASELPLRGSIDTLLADARRDQIDAVVIVQPMHRIAEVLQTCERLRSLVADIYLLTDRTPLRPRRQDIETLEGASLLRIGSRPLDDLQLLSKAILDVSLSSIFLLALSPLLVFIAAIIRLDSPGPVLFRQPRQGYDNQPFTCLKFRTMHVHMTDLLADRQTTRNDPRVTRVGRWLRRWSLDELPQVINVICGDMSLVGPRPHAPNTKVGNQLFHNVVGDYEMRHRVKPGITGWAQVNGWRGETATLDQLHNRVAFDMFYIQNWSLWLDVKIMMLTVTRQIVSRTAY